MLPPLPRCGGGAWSSLRRPTVSAFPGTTAGSARTLSFSRFARRSLALRPAHARGHLYVTRFTRRLRPFRYLVWGFFCQGLNLAPLCFFVYFFSTGNGHSSVRRFPQEAGMVIQLDARDFVTIKGGTRQRSRPMPQYNLVFGSPLRDPP